MRLAAIIVLIGTYSVINTPAHASCATELLKQPQATLRQVLQCVVEAEATLQKGEKGDTGEKGDKGDPGSQGEKGDKGDAGVAAEFPVGVVIASTLRCNQFGTGWEPFRAGTGRFIVGAGTDTDQAYAMWNMALPNGGVEPKPISRYEVLSHGGEEAHILSKSEMPDHAHEFEGKTVSRGGNHGTGRVVAVGDATPYQTYTPEGKVLATTGGGQPASNMPPYIALYLCQKMR